MYLIYLCFLINEVHTVIAICELHYATENSFIPKNSKWEKFFQSRLILVNFALFSICRFDTKSLKPKRLLKNRNSE